MCPKDVVTKLREEDYDVTWAQTAYPGADDEVLLDIAQKEERIVVTFDTDFGTLAVHRNLPASCGVILFRLTPVSPSAVANTVLQAIRSRNDWEGHVSVVDDAQIRMRLLSS